MSRNTAHIFESARRFRHHRGPCRQNRRAAVNGGAAECLGIASLTQKNVLAFPGKLCYPTVINRQGKRGVEHGQDGTGPAESDCCRWLAKGRLLPSSIHLGAAGQPGRALAKDSIAYFPIHSKSFVAAASIEIPLRVHNANCGIEAERKPRRRKGSPWRLRRERTG